jgi:hypothetical protein
LLQGYICRMKVGETPCPVWNNVWTHFFTGMAKAFRRGATWFCNTSCHFKAPAWFGTLNMISFQNLFDGPRGKSDAHTKKYLQTSHN